MDNENLDEIKLYSLYCRYSMLKYFSWTLFFLGFDFIIVTMFSYYRFSSISFICWITATIGATLSSLRMKKLPPLSEEWHSFHGHFRTPHIVLYIATGLATAVLAIIIPLYHSKEWLDTRQYVDSLLHSIWGSLRVFGLVGGILILWLEKFLHRLWLGTMKK